MKKHEKDIIASMRIAIANYHTDPNLSREHFQKFHRLFAERLTRWPEDFAVLWQQMYEIWCAYTPQPTGRFRTTHIEIGYTSHPITKWIDDKIQPPVPTTEELLARFDRLIVEYASAKEAA